MSFLSSDSDLPPCGHVVPPPGAPACPACADGGGSGRSTVGGEGQRPLDATAPSEGSAESADPVASRKPGARVETRADVGSAPRRSRSRTPMDAPPLCTLCFWPVELYHPAASHDGDIVHALCLDARTRRTRADREWPRRAANP